MRKVNFIGNKSEYPNPKGKPKESGVNFSNHYLDPGKGSPLVGTGEKGLSGARVGDNKPGATRWAMNTGDALKNMDSGRSTKSFGAGPKRKK